MNQQMPPQFMPNMLPMPIFETAEMREARRRADELQYVQSNPTDSPCTALNKWLIRNPEAVENFGMITAMLMGMDELHIAPLLTEKQLLEYQQAREQQRKAQQRQRDAQAAIAEKRKREQEVQRRKEEQRAENQRR